MRKVLIILSVIFVFVVTGIFSLRHYISAKKSKELPSAAVANALAKNARLIGHPVVTEWQEYHATRDQALRDHPELEAEYKTLLRDIKKQEADMDAAMIKADPSVAPILLKLSAYRQRSTISTSPPTQPN